MARPAYAKSITSTLAAETCRLCAISMRNRSSKLRRFKPEISGGIPTATSQSLITLADPSARLPKRARKSLPDEETEHRQANQSMYSTEKTPREAESKACKATGTQSLAAGFPLHGNDKFKVVFTKYLIHILTVTSCSQPHNVRFSRAQTYPAILHPTISSNATPTHAQYRPANTRPNRASDKALRCLTASGAV